MNTPQPQPQPVYYAYAAPPTSTYAILALVFGIVGLSPLAVLFGHLGLSKINKGSGEEGKVMAIIGLVLGYIGVAVFVLVVTLFLAAAASTV